MIGSSASSANATESGAFRARLCSPRIADGSCVWHGIVQDHEDLAGQPRFDLALIDGLEEQPDGFRQVCANPFDRIPLARHVQLRAQRDVSIALTVDDRCAVAFRQRVSRCLTEATLTADVSGDGR